MRYAHPLCVPSPPCLPPCLPQASEKNSELAKEHLALTRTGKAMYALRMAAERGMGRREALLRVMRSLVASERKVRLQGFRPGV